MQPRHFAIVAVAVLVAFGAAFGISRAGGGSPEAAATSAKPAELIKTSDATVTANVASTGALPALQVPQKKKKAKTSASTTPASSSTQTPAQGTNPGSTASVTPVVPSTPRTSTQQKTQPSNNDPLKVGGGED